MEFVEQIELQLEIKIFGEFRSFEKLFEYLLELGKSHRFTLFIDEFQKLGKTLYRTLENQTNLHADRLLLGARQ